MTIPKETFYYKDFKIDLDSHKIFYWDKRFNALLRRLKEIRERLKSFALVLLMKYRFFNKWNKKMKKSSLKYIQSQIKNVVRQKTLSKTMENLFWCFLGEIVLWLKKFSINMKLMKLNFIMSFRGLETELTRSHNSNHFGLKKATGTQKFIVSYRTST